MMRRNSPYHWFCQLNLEDKVLKLLTSYLLRLTKVKLHIKLKQEFCS